MVGWPGEINAALCHGNTGHDGRFGRFWFSVLTSTAPGLIGVVLDRGFGHRCSAVPAAAQGLTADLAWLCPNHFFLVEASLQEIDLLRVMGVETICARFSWTDMSSVGRTK
jgi:hypothetical protein